MATFRNIKELSHYETMATDGEIGKIHDFLFDDTTWTIRYLVVDTGGWLPGKRVLLSPTAVKDTDVDNQKVVLDLTQEQVKNSPDISTDKPVSLQQQIELHDYYAWPYYWTSGEFYPVYPPMPVVVDPDKTLKASEQQVQEGDIHLRSTNEVMGYHIQARDDSVGHVEDFLIGDEKWKIHYIVVDTRNWWPGKKVLISPAWISNVTWADEKVFVNMMKETIKESPEYYTPPQ
ncbi:PRC-barrel domain containing protein [candidate division KSB3 bacterium]|uniref:PRC-barrel domain containing protein n=1 Tax=candidate division KSB3 bacterium TaxID=2044937 RepID=A0A9D5Q4Z7_9BACT|nr:PRC-barrel domain containing protein [candidate division KSB3 bacterium]MBD3323803.1 PRC-barrel domain containing protein [candidate division KSB3 bacterium]